MFITYSHKAEHIDATLDTCREVFPLLADAHQSGRIKEQLLTHEVAPAIRRF
jgi:hypothetical protein